MRYLSSKGLGGTGALSYFALVILVTGLDRFEPVLGGLLVLKAMPLYSSMPMVRSKENNIIYSNSMKTDRNELIRRLLSGVTDDELRNLVRVRAQAAQTHVTREKGVMKFTYHRYCLNAN